MAELLCFARPSAKIARPSALVVRPVRRRRRSGRQTLAAPASLLDSPACSAARSGPRAASRVTIAEQDYACICQRQLVAFTRRPAKNARERLAAGVSFAAVQPNDQAQRSKDAQSAAAAREQRASTLA
jgi:hypothetical protein